MNRAEDIEEAAAGLPPAVHERLETVEFKIAHLERALQELSDVLYRQQQQLDAALAANQRLREQLEELEGRTGDAMPVEVPPHY